MSKTKQLMIGLLILSIYATQAFAAVSYRLEDFQSPGTKSSIGIIQFKGDNFFKVGLSPDLQFGPVGLGLDLNLYFALNKDKNVPSELPFLAFRMISYDHYDIWGVKWGRLTNLKYGQGLLMDRYDSGSAGSPEFTTSKAALEAYYNAAPYGVKGLYTATNLKAVRGTYNVGDTVAFGKPLIIGANYIDDSDGVFNDTITTANAVSPAQSGYSIDACVPIFGDTLKGYTEYAKLTNHGDGAAIGFGGSFGPSFSYKLEYRILGADFIPGLYNNMYEAATGNIMKELSPTSPINGILGDIEISFPGDYVKMELMYESYESRTPLLSGALGWRKIGPTIGVINYIKSFTNPDGGRVNASIFYEDFPYVPFPADAIIYIQRDYSNFGDFNKNYTETIAIAIQPNLKKLFPAIPFL